MPGGEPNTGLKLMTIHLSEYYTIMKNHFEEYLMMCEH